MANLGHQAKQVISARLGLDGPPLTWRRTAEAAGVSPKRATVIEEFGIRKLRFGEWQRCVDRRLVAVVGTDAVRARELGRRDPFFSVTEDEECAFAWFVNRLVAGGVRASTIHGEQVVAAVRFDAQG